MTSTDATLLAIHLAATAGMAGLIWFVQIVHYPLFARVGVAEFAAYEARHTRSTAWVVGPLMAVEGVSALVIAAAMRDDVGVGLAAAGLALLAVIHTSTVFVQVPAHRRLSEGFDAATADRLVRTNWVRTVGWSARTVVAAAMPVAAA
ncbi:MAG: hypothetical protein QNJ12_08940 [Ilumatobacter sp.]|uniref:hypothetical protein n=1 Tax=Ilumatobacter sp. TaxID=1967498 RepID=UPI00262A8531|nr:hypothetical protein [Ilumatobacter sp.]MDJ0768907.1 hypothetical protein [Ilumatobacter sp.]